MGTPVHGVTVSDTVRRVFEGVRDRRGGRVLTVNVDVLRQYSRSAFLRDAFEHADLVVTDGMPVVWALRLQGTPVPQRVTGTDLLWALSGKAADVGASVFLAGGREGDAEGAANCLATTYQSLTALSFPCFVEPTRPTDPQLADVAAAIRSAAPDLVFVGLPFANQVELMMVLRPVLPATWFVGVGSSFEFLTGARSRAPEWLQAAGLEWAYRLTQQPRLWRRYLLQGLPFAGRVGVTALGARLSRARGRLSDFASPRHAG